MTTASDIIERIINCPINEKNQWLQIDKDVDEFLDTATKEDIDFLHDHWAEMEFLNNIAFGYKTQNKKPKE